MFWSAEGYCPKCFKDSKDGSALECNTSGCKRNPETKALVPLERHCKTRGCEIPLNAGCRRTPCGRKS